MNTDFLISLEIMWKGMLGLFVVSAFIMLLMMGISKITKARGEKKEG